MFSFSPKRPRGHYSARILGRVLVFSARSAEGDPDLAMFFILAGAKKGCACFGNDGIRYKHKHSDLLLTLVSDESHFCTFIIQ